MNFCSGIFFLVCLVVFSPIFGVGQNNQTDHKVNIEIPEVALLGLVSEESGGINLSSMTPGEAGDQIKFSELHRNNGIWINYSSIIRSQNHRRKVVAAVQGEIPAGLRLIVEATEAVGECGGMLGISAGKVYLSNQPAEVISDIGSCYTGKGTNSGHLLSYRLEAVKNENDFASLAKNHNALHVVYTLTDQN
jgi:hypothetical protein